MRRELEQATVLLQTKDTEKIEEALGLLQGTVYAFSMRICGHREDAEDTMQDVLWRSLPHLAKIDNAQAMAAWLYTVTRNSCRMMRRKSNFAPERTLSLDELMPETSEIVSLCTSVYVNPERTAIREQDSDRLHQAILRIPSKYRLVLVLHDMEELDSAEVAKIMSLTEGTVRVRLHRARLFVRQELARQTLSSNTTVL